MNTYETSATVEDQGHVHVAGVPFAPGARVEVTIAPIPNCAELFVATEPDRTARLLAALDTARNTGAVGPLSPVELGE